MVKHGEFKAKTVYDIENCGNTEIELGDQNARASLTSIEADKNLISRISDDTFKSAKQLTHIDLSENKIEQISIGAFKDQRKLTGLYLKQNKLTRIEVGTFDSLMELKELWLQNNQLSLIEKGLFNKNKKLKDLFMDENQIAAIEPTVFQNLNQQVNIHLAGNLCSNENFQSNKFDQNFACFQSYESLKPHLSKINQLESETKSSYDHKLAYKSENEKGSFGKCEVCNEENERLTKKLEICDGNNLACWSAKSKELSQCEDAKSSIKRDKENLAATLESKESELSKTLGENSNCIKEKDSIRKALNEKLDELSNINNNLSDCQRENKTIHQKADRLTKKLHSVESGKSDTDISFYILIGVVTVELVIIIILLWTCKRAKNEKIVPSNDVELKPTVESHPNENNLIYATLDLKPSKNKTPIKTDEVIYSEVQNVSRPNESTSVVPRTHKK
jgi:Leucine-rich repeat (LRR) protein